MTHYVDISVPLAPGRVPTFPGNPELAVDQVQSRAAGGDANVSRLACSLHTGTHVDGPAHFLAGAPGVDAVPLASLIGPAWVVDAGPEPGMLDADRIRALDLPAGTTRVLVRTTNSALWADPAGFVEDYVAVTPDGAAALVERGIRTVGIDYLSIAPSADPAPTHEVLLGAGVTIIEGLDLRSVDPGGWHLTCLPLRVVGADGAPARAVLSR